MLDVTTTEHPGDRHAISLAIGDRVVAPRDTLVELARQAAGLPPTWFCVPAGTRGTLLGWRERDGDARAIVQLEAGDQRLLMFVSVEHIAPVSRERSARRAVRAPGPMVRLAHRRAHRRRIRD